jgi:hypothetical protein
MKQSSERVITYRHEFKNRIVASLGGKCVICGYNKCYSSLITHHIDPSIKEFTLGSAMKTVMKWEFAVTELRKCVLLCNNCHGELHAGMASLPPNYQRFIEEFADYEFSSRKKKSDKCFCGIQKNPDKQFCSSECFAVAREKTSLLWASVDLEEELKTMSVCDLARKIGCTDIMIHKRLKALGIKRDKDAMKIYLNLGSNI